MRKKFFIKNLALFLIPVLVPILILGMTSFYFVQQYVNNEVTRNNTNLFTQIDRNFQLIFQELDSLYLSFSSPGVIYSLKEVLRTNSLTFEQNQLMNTLKATIDTPPNARPYIESVYVYINNNNGYFLTSTMEGLARMNSYHDLTWYETYLGFARQEGVYTAARTITRYSFEKPTAITTVYKTLTSATRNIPDGVIVVNLYNQYIENLLQNIETLPNQSLLIVDEQDQILFRNYDFPYLEQLDMGLFSETEDTALTLRLGDEAYSAFQLLSPENGWRYISITPSQSLYAVPGQLHTLTLVSVGISLILGLAIAYFLTTRSVGHIRRILSIIHSTERNQPIPELAPSANKDEYGLIMNNIVQSFIEQNQLKLQLSEKKYLLKSAELLALQHQMNPHFLFNTLETIYWKVMGMTGKPNEANAMLESLSKILHYSLDGTGGIVSLEQEITYTKSYIDIQKIRYPNRFHVIWQYNEEDIQRYSIVKLSLQPLIENCIYHGIKEKEGAGCIKIKIKRFPDTMRITVTDNGKGMTAEQLAHIHQQLEEQGLPSGHIGLYNTNRRLALIYGSAYRLWLRSKPGRGTVIDLHIPI